MANQWQPNPKGLEEVYNLLRTATAPAGKQVQLQIVQQLKHFRKVPDFNNYLVTIFERQDLPEEIRFQAGILLKNNVLRHFKTIPDEVLQYVKQHIVNLVGDQSALLRRTCASVITTIVSRGKLTNWPGVVEFFTKLLDSNEPLVLNGAFEVLRQICEDTPRTEIDPPNGNKPLNVLVPRLIQFFGHPSEELRQKTLEIMNFVLYNTPTIIVANFDAFLQGIFTLATDPYPQVRLKVCKTFTTLVYLYAANMQPRLDKIIEYMLLSSQDKHEGIRLEALEFWTAICEHEQLCYDSLKPHLAALIDVLLRALPYSPEDLLALGMELSDNAAVPDAAKDIKPHVPENDAGAKTKEDDDDDDDDDDNILDEGSDGWTLRKSSATAVDALAYIFGEDMLQVLLPRVSEMVKTDAWIYREAAVLALGTVSNGAHQFLGPHMNTILPFLVSLLNDQVHLIRSITCWTLGRYAKWLMNHHEAKKMISDLLNILLPRVLDPNKKVQHAAVSALANIMDDSREFNVDMRPHLDNIINVLAQAANSFQIKNRLVLWDAIGTLAETVGSALNRPRYVEALVPPMIQFMLETGDEDVNLYPVLQALPPLILSLGIGFQQYAGVVFNKAITLIEKTILGIAAAADMDMDPPPREFMILSLDIIAALTESLNSGVSSLVTQSNLLNMLVTITQDPRGDVLQSAFALIGDLAQWVLGYIKPALPQLINAMIAAIHPKQYATVCNNASWAMGEIAVQIGDEMKPFVIPILEKLVPIINEPKLEDPMLKENAAICIGRLCLSAADMIVPIVPQFVNQWLPVLRDIASDTEKESAFRGLCTAINAAPLAFLPAFYELCLCFVSWNRPKEDLRNMFHQILHAYKQKLGPENWAPSYNKFPEDLRKALKERYNLD